MIGQHESMELDNTRKKNVGFQSWLIDANYKVIKAVVGIICLLINDFVE